LGEVSGQGQPAALYAALAVGTLRGVHKTGTSPQDVLATLGRVFAAVESFARGGSSMTIGLRHCLIFE